MIVVAGLSAALMAVTACTGSRAHTAPPTPAALSTPAPTLTPTLAIASTASGQPRHDPDDFGPDAVSFVSPTLGWALAVGPCPTCGRLFRTADAGQHWTRENGRIALPGAQRALEQGLLDMNFANRTDGYIVTGYHCRQACVVATTDGGRTWRPAALPRVGQLIAGRGSVYLLSPATPGHDPVLLRSPIGSRHWTTLPLPRPTSHLKPALDEVAADGDTVAVLTTGYSGPSPTRGQLGRLAVSTDQGDTWSPRPVPCTVDDGGAALISVAHDHPNALLIDCWDNEQSSDAARTRHHLYGSSDDGASWVRLADPSHTGQPVLLADNGAGHAFLATNGNTDILSATLDGAASWHQVITQSDVNFYGWADLRFVSASTGFVLGPTHYATEHLYRTQDAGRSWHTIPLPAQPR